MSKYIATFMALLLTMPVFGTVVGFDADDFSDHENMHTPIPEMTLWRSTYMHRFDKLYSTIFAVPSTDPTKPLGDRVIGWLISPVAGYSDYWFDEPYLYITINGLASSIRIKTANKPNWIRKTVVVDCFDIDGNQVAHNFDNIGGWLTTNVGEYTIKSVCIWTVGMMSIDNIEINHIPEPSTFLLLGLGVVLLGRKSRTSVLPLRSCSALRCQ